MALDPSLKKFHGKWQDSTVVCREGFCLYLEEVTIFKLVGRRSHERHGADTGNQTPVVACHALAQGDTRPVVGDPAEPDPGLCRAYFSENRNLDSPIRELESRS